MANHNVVTDEHCGCDDCNGGGGNIGIVPSINPIESIIVRSKPGILKGNIINSFTENGRKIFELDDFTLVKPLVELTNDAGVVEVGINIPLITFIGLITPGSYPIASRSISPDPGGLDLAIAFTFQKTNVKLSSPGIVQKHIVQATDVNGNITLISSGVPFKAAFYQGFNGLATLDQNTIKGLANKNLIDSILQKFGGEKTYVVPNPTPKYIYWSGPVGTQVPIAAILNGLPLPIINIGNVNVTNINDASLTPPYWVVRTANRLDPGTYLITLN